MNSGYNRNACILLMRAAFALQRGEGPYPIGANLTVTSSFQETPFRANFGMGGDPAAICKCYGPSCKGAYVTIDPKEESERR
jgi:hypothetical protein